jgi:hypothetical protein
MMTGVGASYDSSSSLRHLARRAMLALVALLLMCGCNATVSISPLYDRDSGTSDPRLVGRWVTDRGLTVNISHEEGHQYRMVLEGTHSSNGRQREVKKEYFLRPVKLKGSLYLDISATQALDLDAPEKFEPLMIPGHLIVACSLEDGLMRLRFISAEKVERLPENGGGRVRYVRANGRVILTSESAELRKLLADNAADVLSSDSFVLRSAPTESK